MKGLSFALLQRLILLLLLYTLFRLFFYAYNFQIFAETSTKDIVRAMFYGLRFDLSAIFVVNFLFIIYWTTIPSSLAIKEGLDKFFHFMFVLINTLFAAFNLADAELFLFNGKRLDIHYFLIVQDIIHQSIQLAANYWGIFFFILFLGYIFHLVNRTPIQEENLSAWRRLTLLFIVIFVSIFFIRGGLQNKPLKEAHAFVFQQPSLGHLSLNSTFTFIQSRKSLTPKNVQLMSDVDVAKILPYDFKTHFAYLKDKKINIVILILESFANEYIGVFNAGDGYTPFFDQLSKRGLLFHNFYANGRRSIEAVPAILSGLPSLLGEAFLTSSVQGARIFGLGEILNPLGYETAFFHGAQNGTMFFDSFVQRIGVQKYFGLNEYPDKKDYDGFWGIYDEPFFIYSAAELSKLSEPFAATIFSLSSHQPYHIPPEHQGRFRRGQQPILETIGYADYSLKRFFEFAEKEPWYKNTVFIITGDHTSTSVRKGAKDDRSSYRVPLLIYSANFQWPPVDLKLSAQHADILPTVLDILRYDPNLVKKMNLHGQSVFQNNKTRFVVNRVADGFWYESQGVYIKVDADFQVRDVLPKNLERSSMDWHITRLKAYIQRYYNSILTNNSK